MRDGERSARGTILLKGASVDLQKGRSAPGESSQRAEHSQIWSSLDDRGPADVRRPVDRRGIRGAVLHSGGRWVREAIARWTGLLLRTAVRTTTGYGASWHTAAWIETLDRNLPVVMMTGHKAAADEAIAARSKRSRAADFAAVIPKPYDIDELLAALDEAVKRGVVRRASDSETLRRVTELREKLTAAGAREISTSTRRGMTFRVAEDGSAIYWGRRCRCHRGALHADGRG